MYQRTFLGPKPEERSADLSSQEVIAVAPLIGLMIYMGIASSSFLPAQSAVTSAILKQTKMNVEFRVGNEDRNGEVRNGY
jgi:NADH:ubiquinone oxidoreductase subunit 4 (subunit M)